MRKKIQILILLCVLSAPRLSSAEPSEWTEKPTYFDRATSKLGYGLTNVGKGWSEIYVHMIKADQEDRSIMTGLVRGTAFAVADTLGGVFHAATFFLPIDLPLPEGGAHGFSGNPSANS